MTDGSIVAIATSAISNVGFPIVACYGMYRYINTTMKDYTDSVKENTQMIHDLTIYLKKEGASNDDRK